MRLIVPHTLYLTSLLGIKTQHFNDMLNTRLALRSHHTWFWHIEHKTFKNKTFDICFNYFP